MAKVLSIEIGILTTKIAEMDLGVKKPKVYKCIEIQTPGGVVEDGYLRPENIDKIKNAIKNTLTENKIRTKKVMFTVFSGKIISREIMIPAVKPHQINAVISANVKDYFPVELDDYKISHIHLSTFKEGPNAGKHMVLVVAMEKKLISMYETLAQELNLHIVDIDYAGNSIYQAARQKAGHDAVLVAKVEADSTVVTIIRNGTLVLQRNLNNGYSNHDSIRDEVNEESIRLVVGTIIRLIDFYIGNNDKNVIDHIFLSGDGAGKDEIRELIEEQTHLPCRVLEKVSGVILHKDLMDNDLYRFISVIGSGKASIGLDTEKEKERHQTDYFNASILIVILLIVAAAAIVSLSVIPYKLAQSEEKRLIQLEEQYAEAGELYNKYLGVNELYNSVQYGDSLTRNSNDEIISFLTELENKLPSDVEVSEFSSNATQCIISMYVADKETAAGVIETFRNDFTSLKKVSVESITEQAEEGAEPRVFFTINCEYNDMQLSEQPVKEDNQ